jgi:hypothetical protein
LGKSSSFNGNLAHAQQISQLLYFLPNFLPKAQISFWKEISFQMETLQAFI